MKFSLITLIVIIATFAFTEAQDNKVKRKTEESNIREL